MTTTTTHRYLPALNVVFFVLTLIANGLSSAGIINNRSTQEISNSLPSYFTPANFTFSVWGVIYLGLIAFVIYQALPSQRNNPLVQRIGYLFIVSSLANIGWIFAWHYGLYALTVPLMLTLLVSLILVYVRLGIGLPATQRPMPITRSDRWLIDVPFSLYLAWITVANIANVATTLVSFNWNGFGIAEPTWSAIMILIAGVVATLVLVNRMDFAFAGVILWALYGIYSKQGSESAIMIAALLAFVIVTVAAIVGWYRTRGPATPATMVPA